MKKNEFIEIKKELNVIQDQITDLRNKEYKLNDKYTNLLMEKCKENIGRCFKKAKSNQVLFYCKIINIDKQRCPMTGNVQFNEYQYPALWFGYPYNGSRKPFYEDDLFSGAWEKGNDLINKVNDISYIEITDDEFFDKFNEVNSKWIDTIRLLTVDK